MAKARKQQKEAENGNTDESTTAVVAHQTICLSIDTIKRRLYGYTELQVIVPLNGIIGLRAHNLVIENVKVDGEVAEFQLFPVHNHLHINNENKWSSVSSASLAADAARSVYLSCIDREFVPNLLIMCVSNELEQPLSEFKQDSKLIRIEYFVENDESGIYFDKDVVYVDNRTRCWFPCMDDSELQCCCYHMEFTVANNLVAASTGTLLYSVLNEDDDTARKTYVYKVEVPVSARLLSLLVAPFEIFADSDSGGCVLSHMCLPNNLARLRNTVGFFHSLFKYYEDYLDTSFPFGSYTQVFIAPEMAISSLSVGASMSVFSSKILYDEKVIDQTMETRIKLAYALARQWFGVYITAASPNDDWLIDGLAWFLTDLFIKQFLGNNEARYRRYKANCAVCKSDDSAATALCCSSSCKDLYGTKCIGFIGKLRSWKSVAVLQMLEKQMGPESFRKILQRIVIRAKDATHSLRSLSSKEFRQFANKIGNLERPFLKEFFPRWIESYGCPVLKMGFSYSKRKNIFELAVMRGFTAMPDTSIAPANSKAESENREGGWPGMMSIRVHELDGMYDHPILPMAGETGHLLEIQCHSKLAAKRRPKNSAKPDGSDGNDEAPPGVSNNIHCSNESPLLWIRADPEMEYLAEIHFNQPVQMWINQLEKDKDVVAQAQAIATLEMLPQPSFSVVNALNSILTDSKAFWRIRVEVAFTLANTASEETDWAGLHHLLKFYKSRRCDANTGLPKANDFRDFPEYFVLKAIPHAIAMVRSSDNKSPREAVEFILQLLKYNDNNGNPFSDVFWLASLVQSIGELEFGQQNIILLSSILKRVDRLLQFDRLMPSYNGVLTVSCIRTLTQIALKLDGFIPLDCVFELIKPFRSPDAIWEVRIEATRALLDLEFQCSGIDVALMRFITYLEEESSFKGQLKLGVHALRLCQLAGSILDISVRSETLVALLCLLECPAAINNVNLRHYLFCILQVLAGRPPTLSGVPRDETLRMGHAETCTELKNIFAALVKQSKPPVCTLNPTYEDASVVPGPTKEVDTEEIKSPLPLLDTSTLAHGVPVFPESTDTIFNSHEQNVPVIDLSHDVSTIPESLAEINDISKCDEQNQKILRQDSSMFVEGARKLDTVSCSQEQRKPVVKLKVKQSVATSKAEDAENAKYGKSQGGHDYADHGASSSFSSQRNLKETVSNQNIEDVNSCHDVGSHVTASIGSAKLASDGDELLKELQCTADSSKNLILSPPDTQLLPDVADVDIESRTYVSLQSISGTINAPDYDLLTAENPFVHTTGKEKKKSKDKKRKGHDRKRRRDDPEYLERKRMKKEKKQKQQLGEPRSRGTTPSLAALCDEEKTKVSIGPLSQEVKSGTYIYESNLATVRGEGQSSPLDQREAHLAAEVASLQMNPAEPSSATRKEGGAPRKILIKLKTRTVGKP
ncbi:Transcription initiation factor TFIID subunit 2 [Heracleum sosnowskyi]|uniref:Transcription initiation factor TFIID subunit 2 n=1 Tax=Heracleum sosnowskyi TaxID=360622 RepID=A0AAD8M4V1_9APIA|nr:Transcription initiation factor TFIID subunit 2 [Heracleum sosnowskyi]